ncbi:hypothetical protein BDF22DRAFT_679210 [Syncephalis plumigaleata]|nr:hypothetical protein BDF22DRAFT_679210 [Syncephalis plumigaleata]
MLEKVSEQAAQANATARSTERLRYHNRISNPHNNANASQNNAQMSAQDRLALLKSMQSSNKWAKPTIPDTATPNNHLPYTKTVRDRGHAPVTSQWTNTESRRNPESVNESHPPANKHHSNPSNSARSMFNHINQHSGSNSNHQQDSQASHWAKRKQLDRERQARRNQSSRIKPYAKHNGDDVDHDSSIVAERHKEKTTKKQPVVKLLQHTVANLGRLLVLVLVKQLAERMNSTGLTVTAHDHVLTADEASLVVMEFGYTPYPLRPPVVTVMGHVDHGKTSLLDALRKTSVAAGEAGGITQHIGAFSVMLPSKQRITFLDTPGHAAFCAMRARGAHTTDIVVLVVAADDSVMPQTIEAIEHAQAAKVPIIVAINKCDKEDADPSKVKNDLLRYGVQLEEHGGDTQIVEVSAVTGKGLEELEENILVQAELLDLRAEDSIPAEGIILESGVDKGLGKAWCLKPGMTVLAGTAHGRARVMINDQGATVKEAGPGTPIKLTGWRNLPAAGDELLVADSEELAKKAIQNRMERIERQKELQDLEAINEKRRILREEENEDGGDVVETQTSTIPELPLVIKGDVSGTVEAVVSSLQGLPANKVRLNVIHAGVGAITDSDVDLAATAQGMIFGFNVKYDKRVQSHARASNVKIVTQTVIYRLIEEAKKQLIALLPKVYEPKVNGEARVLQLFSINTKGRQYASVAGCRVTNGVIKRGEKVRVLRGQDTVFDGQLETLKNVKKDIDEAGKGLECGMSFIGFQDFQPDDIVQSYVMVEKEQTL